MKINTAKSISQLENWKWKDRIPTPENNGGIVYRFYLLHNKPINDLKLNDIRFLIGQNSGLDYLVPIAIEALKENIFIETEYFPGDLLSALFQIDSSKNYWLQNPKMKNILVKLYNGQEKQIAYLNVPEDIKEKIKDEFLEFLNPSKEREFHFPSTI